MDAESSIKALGNEALRDLYNNLVAAKAFALEQAPDVCRQIIAWEIADGVFGAVALVAIATLFIWQVRKLFRILNDEDAVRLNREILPMIASFVLGAGTAISALNFIVTATSAVKAIVAPKLVLIEYIAAVIK